MTTGIELSINGQRRTAPAAAANDPLLWVLREDLQLIGTKFGCGQGVCGACTVHIDGVAARSCMTACGDLGGKRITTIEADSLELQALRRAWLELNVAQCGYCQAGQIMSAAALLAKTPKPSTDDIDTAMAGNLCRCATYIRIRAGITRAAELLNTGGKA
jgi:isoquinoline 1-oxidoreductase alpha subunit